MNELDNLRTKVAELEAALREAKSALERMEIAFTPLAKDSTLANIIDESREAIATINKVLGEE